MKKSINTCATILLILTVAVLNSCKKDQDTNLDQSDDIVSYLESSHSPKLVSDSALLLLEDDVVEPPFYTRYGTYAYRYISTYYALDRDKKAEVLNGSTVSITYSFFEFTGSSNSSTLPLQTNDPAYKEDLIEAGLNTQYQSFEPKSIVIGGELLSSLHDGLIGCREGDVVELYITYEMAYDNSIIGFVSKGGSLEVHCTIESVN